MAKSGLTDTDKILVTAALWLAGVSLFAAAITLYMLPDDVTIVYNIEFNQPEYSSKYYNIILSLTSFIPATIIIAAMALKKHNRLRNNFISVIILGIMLSMCMSGIVVYGISRQFASVDSSVQPADGINRINVHVFISLSVCVLLSLLSSSVPLVVHSRTFAAGKAKRGVFTTFMSRWLADNWAVGAFGFLLTGIACSFITGYYSYIPLAAFTFVMLIAVPVCTYKEMKLGAEIEAYDMLEQKEN